MQSFKVIRSRTVVLPATDIDTDQIIPARFLTTTTREGFGSHLFADWRYDAQGVPRPDFVLNRPESRGCSILVAGRNFGCGSSREHAPQALMRFGIKAIVGESFAEIFFGNCTANGIPAVSVSSDDARRIASAVAADPAMLVTVDLAAQKVQCGRVSTACTMQEGARQALVTGNWDFLGQLIEAAPQIRVTAERLPYMKDFADTRG